MMAQETLHIYSNVLSCTLKFSPHKDSTSKIHSTWRGRMYLHLFVCFSMYYHKASYVLLKGSASALFHIELLNYVSLYNKKKSADRMQKKNLNSFLAINVTQIV